MSSILENPTFAVLTLGCKVNQYESEAIAEALEAFGFTQLPSFKPCDLYVINTCTVTAESDRKARQLIRRLAGQHPNAFLVVTGCSAQSRTESIASIAGVDAVVGNREKLRVATIARELMERGVKAAVPIVEVPALNGAAFEPMSITRFIRTRAYVKIQDGCESRCTYCAIPAARGPVRSKPMADVVAEVTALAEGGCREVVLTGIETGAWGRDLGSLRLQDLLLEIERIPHPPRIRLGSLDPTVMTQDFVDKIKGLHCLAPHFHLSMQSGCSATLARMRRKYNASQAEAAMDRVRTAIPQVQFTTDMIVGFPGETEEEFAESLDFARRSKFLHIHVFPYSKRDGTPAAVMKDQVPESVKKERVAVLSRVSEESCAAILDRVLARPNTVLSVLPETYGEGFMMAHTPDFLEVKIHTDCRLPHEELTVKPVSREGEVLVCVPCLPDSVLSDD
ncbi:MAG: tRNA (N(6)-L-threonylcarbamoyladenosine(37)-C(2))-methylthiotransferase MtaB [Clostridia bacterium]|nr:tRNA (N(6)-L-threonylcarbamoyladenosine(37)-C(2))-methylthiotransferase MtaB [Clostridia bacterium]